MPISESSSGWLEDEVPGPGLTAAFTYTGEPWVRVIEPFTQVLSVLGAVERHKVVEVGWKPPAAAVQFVTKLYASTEPRPVARSKPVPALNAGTPFGTPLEFVCSKIPYAPSFAVSLQAGLAPTQGTELLPRVTSWNVHLESGDEEELQFNAL